MCVIETCASSFTGSISDSRRWALADEWPSEHKLFAHGVKVAMTSRFEGQQAPTAPAQDRLSKSYNQGPRLDQAD